MIHLCHIFDVTRQKNLTFGKKDPTFGKKDPTFGKKDPTFGRKDPTIDGFYSLTRRKTAMSGRKSKNTVKRAHTHCIAIVGRDAAK